MAETTLTINSYSWNRIRVEEMQVSAQGWPEYPRLLIPASVGIHPVEDIQGIVKRHFVIFDVLCSLSLEDGPAKIADAIPGFNRYEVSRFKSATHFTMEFPLNPYQIKRLEVKRSGDMRLMLSFQFRLGLYNPLNDISAGRQSQNEHLTDFENPYVQLPITIPQSCWVQNVLSRLGDSEYFLVEVPKGNELIRQAWVYLEKAQSGFAMWDTRSVCANCRSIGQLLDGRLKEKFGRDSFTYEIKWARAYGTFKNLASIDLHLEDYKKSSKYNADDSSVTYLKSDAEHLLIITKSLIKYAEELLRQ